MTDCTRCRDLEAKLGMAEKKVAIRGRMLSRVLDLKHEEGSWQDAYFSGLSMAVAVLESAHQPEAAARVQAVLQGELS